MKKYRAGSTYAVNEVTEPIWKKMKAADAWNRGELIAREFWQDDNGDLHVEYSNRATSEYYYVCYEFDNSGNLISSRNEFDSTSRKLLPRNGKEPVILITGDLHGDVSRVFALCSEYQTTKNDILIVLGDSGINFYDELYDRPKKR